MIGILRMAHVLVLPDPDSEHDESKSTGTKKLSVASFPMIHIDGELYVPLRRL